jgi:hypothetical protein
VRQGTLHRWVWVIIGLDVRQNTCGDIRRNNSSLCNSDVAHKGGRGDCTGAEEATT